MAARSALDAITPATRAAAVTPSDSTDLDVPCRAINVAAAGNVSVITTGGDTVTVNVAAGIAFPLEARRIRSTGTTATDIVALW